MLIALEMEKHGGKGFVRQHSGVSSKTEHVPSSCASHSQSYSILSPHSRLFIGSLHYDTLSMPYSCTLLTKEKVQDADSNRGRREGNQTRNINTVLTDPCTPRESTSTYAFMARNRFVFIFFKAKITIKQVQKFNLDAQKAESHSKVNMRGWLCSPAENSFALDQHNFRTLKS